MHNESRCDGCGLKLAYLMLTFKKAELTTLAENCIREILPLPFSLVINVYLLVFLIFIHLLRYKMFLWRTLGQSVLSLWGDFCGIMWWANTFGCIQVLLTRHSWKWIPPLLLFSLLCFEAVIGNLLTGPGCLLYPPLTLLVWQTSKSEIPKEHCKDKRL